MNKLMEDSLERALLECRNAARKGYEVAKDNLHSINLDIGYMSSLLSQYLNSLNSSQIRTKEVGDQLRMQLLAVVTELTRLVDSTSRDLEERSKGLDNFVITVFGRTMAGKSTLMEILTNGNGASIGTGSQRTTRDVRSYQWKGMTVIDVPGVAAFEGQQDEEVAYEAAKNADLILFLITDDAPQPAEAECLAKILKLGKSVIGICNVKFAIDGVVYMKLLPRNLECSFDQGRLIGVYRQFNQFLASYNPCAHLHFIPAHLRASYLAAQKEYSDQRKMLMDASRFRDVELRIIHAVTGSGTFYRIRSFIDGSVVPMLQLIDRLLEFSVQNSSSGRVLVDKHRQLKRWEQEFAYSGEGMIRTCISKVTDQLRGEVPEFAESHYEDKDAGANWEYLVGRKNINGIVQRLQRQLVSDCQNKLSEIARELECELSLVSEYASNREISIEAIHDYKRMWQWGVNIAAGVLGVAALAVSGPLGWAAAGVGAIGFLFSFLFDSHEEKAKKAREKLSSRLYKSINKTVENLSQKMNEWFHKELLGKQVHVLMNDLSSVTEGMFSLADAQRELAWILNDRQKKLNRTLIEEALRQLDAGVYFECIKDIAREPNSAIMLLIPLNVTIPQKIRHNLEKMLGERIWFVIDSQNEFFILKQAIGKKCDSRNIHIEKKIGVAHVPLNEFDEMTMIRVRLAQQLTRLHITL